MLSSSDQSQGLTKGTSNLQGFREASGIDQVHMQQASHTQGATQIQGIKNSGNLKSYISELKKATNANNKSKRGHSGHGNKQTTQMLRSQQAAVYGATQNLGHYNSNGSGSHSSKNGNGVGFGNGPNRSKGIGTPSDLVIEDNAIAVNKSQNQGQLQQLMSPSSTYGRSQRNRGGSTGASGNQIHLMSPQNINITNQGSHGYSGGVSNNLSASNGLKNISGYSQNLMSPMSNNSGASHGKMQNSGAINYNGSKAYAYLQKKGNANALMNQTSGNNMHNNVSTNGTSAKNMINVVQNNQVASASADFHASNNNSSSSNSHNNLIRRISSGRKSGLQSEGLGQKSRRSNTRGTNRNNSQVQSQSQGLNLQSPSGHGNLGMLQNESRTTKNSSKTGLIGNNISQNYLNQVSAVAGNANHNIPMGNFPLSAKNAGNNSVLSHHNSNSFSQSKQTGHERNQKDVIIRKHSSKSLLPAAQNQQSNSTHSRGKSQPSRAQIQSEANALLLKTDSTAADGISEAKSHSKHNHKRLASQGGYVKVQNSELSSQVSGGENAQQFLSQAIGQTTSTQHQAFVNGQFNNNQRAINHTLGNTLGKGQQSLNMSNYGGYYSAVARDSSLNEQNPTTLAKALNLSCLLRQNLLEEDGIEDLHFYFVSFNQHKKLILNHQKQKAKAQVLNVQAKTANKQIKGKQLALVQGKKQLSQVNQKPTGKGSSTDYRNEEDPNKDCQSAKTIESCDDEELF